MAKWCNDSVLDAALNSIKNNANLMVICSQQPANRTDAVTTYALGNVSMAAGDFTVAAGDVSGRKCTVAAKNITSCSANGTANHVALVDAANLLYVSTFTNQVVTSGNPANVGSWKMEIQAPS